MGKGVKEKNREEILNSIKRLATFIQDKNKHI